MTSKRFSSSSIALILLITLTSCLSIRGSDSVTPSATKLTDTPESSITTPTGNTPQVKNPTPTQTQIIAVTASTSVSIFDSPNQITDGKLKMTIQILDKNCLRPGDVLPVTVRYENLTNQPLTLVDYSALSSVALMGGYAILVPVLSTIDNQRLQLPGGITGGDIYNSDSPQFQEISPRSSFSTLIDYHIPMKVVSHAENVSGSDHKLKPGQYLLKFIYYAFRGQNAWQGRISSNQIEICVID